MKLIITTVDDTVGATILNTLKTIDALGGGEKIQVTIEGDRPTHRRLPARTYYRATHPEQSSEVLKSLGPMEGIVYTDIVEATNKGVHITERDIRDTRLMEAGTVQGAIQRFRAAGLVESVPIPKAEGAPA